jgi:magnesium chelatase subunit D
MSDPARTAGPRGAATAGGDSDAAAHRRLLRLFRCAAADPRLGGVLLFDVPQGLVRAVGELFTATVSGAGGPPAIVLGAATREDDLWSRTRLVPVDGRIAVDVRHGDLVEADGAAPPRTVLVPDLTRLGLTGLRAAVTLLGAETASVERHGASIHWRPRARWLAFARRDDVGRLSPHLLDRFPLRLTLPGLVLPPGGGADSGDPAGVPAPGPVPRPVPGTDRPGPALEEAALSAVVTLSGPGAGERRSLALARLARALAGSDEAPATTADHVARAARLIGLTGVRSADVAARPDTGPDEDIVPEPGPDAGPDAAVPDATAAHDGASAPVSRAAPLSPPGAAELLDAFSGEEPPAAAGEMPGPYPEDEAETLREFAPLRGPWRRSSGRAAARGPVVGVRRATDLHDLAFVATVVEAANHQMMPGRAAGAGALTVHPADLRSHARAAEPERMLVLLLDHSCRHGWEWADALAPYLQWAYTSRATAAVVELGARDARDELRATVFTARNVLDPRLAKALERRPGRATPLAHGVLLAAQVVRRAFQQQPAALAEAWLVVATDARGNVPLRAGSAPRPLTGAAPDGTTGPVGRQGVEDALAVARQLGALGRMRLHTVLLDVGALPYADLPFALAEAMGGTVVAGPATVRPEGGPEHVV